MSDGCGYLSMNSRCLVHSGKLRVLALPLVADFSVMSYFDNNGNLVDGGAAAAWMETAEIGSLKAAGLVALIQGGGFLQSAAVTSEMMGMGSSASVGVFVVGTKAKAL